MDLERTRGQRRAAIAVVALVVVVVGTLIWKPWDSSSGAPSATAVAALKTPSPSPSDTPDPRDLDGVELPAPATPEPPTPIAPDPGPQLLDVPGLGSVAFYPNEGPGVWCIYKTGSSAGRDTLSVVVAEPPLIVVSDTALLALRTVRWHIELETNTQDKLFESAWTPVGRSKATSIDIPHGQVGFVKPISVDAPAESSITVFRAPIVIDWLGAKQRVLASQRVMPATYGVLGARSPAQSGGCPSTI